MSATQIRIPHGVDPAKLASEKAEGARIICRRLDAGQVITVGIIDPPGLSNGSLATLSDCEESRKLFGSARLDQHRSGGMKRAYPHVDDLQAMYARRPAGPGDPISVHPASGAKSPGSSGLGPFVITKDQRLASLVCAHALASVQELKQCGNKKDFAYQPPHEFGGRPDKHKLGLVEIKPLPFSIGQRGVDTGLIYLERDQYDRDQASWVRPRLWAGFFALRAGKIPADMIRKVRAPSGLIDEGWLRQQFPDLNLGNAYQVSSHPIHIPLGCLMQGDLEIRTYARKERLLVVVTGTLGRVKGSAAVGEKDLGSSVFMCGPKSGLTEGRIWGVNAWVDGLTYSSKLPAASFMNWFLVEGLTTDWPFSRPGDSNSAIYFLSHHNINGVKNNDLIVCGQVVAGVMVRDNAFDKMLTLVQPIEPCLNKWEATLLKAN